MIQDISSLGDENPLNCLTFSKPLNKTYVNEVEKNKNGTESSENEKTLTNNIPETHNIEEESSANHENSPTNKTLLFNMSKNILPVGKAAPNDAELIIESCPESKRHNVCVFC